MISLIDADRLYLNYRSTSGQITVFGIKYLVNANLLWGHVRSQLKYHMLKYNSSCLSHSYK